MSTIYDLRHLPGISALIARLESLDSAAVAYSGGTDSAFLLKSAHDVLGARCIAITAVSPAFPDAGEGLCASEGIRRICFQADVLRLSAFRDNPPERCYHCKRFLFQQMQEIARSQGCKHVLDGSNRDDLSDYRPGLRALSELGVLSPLRGFTKDEIRAASRMLELPTWNLPSAACLASRIPYGEPVTAEKLERIGRGEALLHGLGFDQCRVRCHRNLARIEVRSSDLPRLVEQGSEIEAALRSLGFAYVAADLRGFRSGSMNEELGQKEANHGSA